ncbi:MAG: alpha/beta hydrolase [Acidimicrobiia bacterium]
MIGDDEPVLHVPARDIPLPSTVSPEARAVLARGGTGGTGGEGWPEGDTAAWKRRIARQDERVAIMRRGRSTIAAAADVVDLDVDGVTVYEGTPHGGDPDDGRAHLSIHGGALILGGGAQCRASAGVSAAGLGIRTWAVDYRMPPDDPYPAPLDDCVTAYRALLRDHRPGEIVVSGGSAGANLAAALILRARDEGLPLPAAAVLQTPELDLTESGDTFRTNLGVDTVLGSLMTVNLLYADGHDLADPYLSPLFGDFTRGFPPTILTSGTRDLFLSNAVRMHRALRAAGVEAELHVLEAAPHGAFLGQAPEDRDLAREVSRFIAEHWTP